MKNILSLLIILSSFMGFSQDNLTLSDAISKGLANNFDISIIKKNEEIANNNNTWGNAGRYPSLQISANQVNSFDSRPSTIDGSDTETTTNAVYPSATLNWLLFNGFAVNTTKSNLENIEKLSQGNSAIVVENTIQAIILSYYQCLLEKEKLKVQEEVMKLSEDKYKYIIAKKELGTAITFDVLQLKSALLNDSTNFYQQQINYKNSLRNLNLLLGEADTVEYNPIDEFEIELKSFDINDLSSKMESNNNTLQNQYLNKLISENNVKLAKNSKYPSLSLSSGYDYGYGEIKINDFPKTEANTYGYYANLRLSFNIFNGNKTNIGIQNAKIHQEIAQVQTEQMKHSLNNKLKNLFETYELGKKMLNVSLTNLESAELNLKIAEEKYKTGAINSFNFRDIQLVYLNTSYSTLISKFNLINTHTELIKITGGILTEN